MVELEDAKSEHSTGYSYNELELYEERRELDD